MKLIRQIPSNVRQVGFGVTIFNEFIFYYRSCTTKYIKIVTSKRFYCYEGNDCF